ncbi:MAG: hypothetical protein PF489_15775 [Salinivirgaceae bacterium]|jgi:hypothetical protein|nr:hypothetical protein [Salinivirgaceae bacterium]
MNRIIIIGILVMMFSGSYAKTPPWADLSVDKHFYYGVGMSFKKKAPRSHFKQTGEKYMNDYVEEARKKAIKNLAENISGVVVSGSTDDPEMLITNTRLRSLDVYKIKEYNVEYWVAVRIPKEVVEEIRKEMRLEKARNNLKGGKKEMKKNAFDEEFK